MSNFEIHNEGKYITNQTISLIYSFACKSQKKTIHVDKDLAGSGFTTALIRNTDLKILIIEPNRQTVIDKSQKEKLNHISYVFGGSDINNIRFANSIMTVADSLLYNKEIQEMEFDLIVVDESHTITTQSLFRANLRGFESKLRKIYSKTPLVFVTATPLQSTVIDVKITYNKYPDIKTVKITHDIKGAVKEAIKLNNTNKNVIVFTNSASIISLFADKGQVLKGQFKVGKNILKSLCKRCELIEDKESNIIFASSSSFEGWDYLLDDAFVYLFEDKKQGYARFTSMNIIQAFERARNGAKSYTYAVALEDSSMIYTPTKEQVNKFIKGKTFTSVHKRKIEGRDNKMYPFISSNTNGKPIVNIDYLVLNQQRFIDSSLINVMDYLKLKRYNPELKYISNSKVRANKSTIEEKTNLIRRNKDLIVKYELYKGTVKTYGNNEKQNVIKLIILELEYKKCEPDEMLLYSNINSYKKALSLLNRLELEKEDIIRLYREYKQIKVNNVPKQELKKLDSRVTSRAEKKWVNNEVDLFEANYTNLVTELILALINDGFTSEILSGFRKYSIFTQLSKDIIMLIAEKLEIKVGSIDIKNAYPRIAYAICGKVLPDDFYGTKNDPKRTKNKIRVNTLMNDLSKFSKGKGIDQSKTNTYLKYNKKKNLITAGFDKDVAEWLIDIFFDEVRGFAFDYFSRHEEIIINKLTKKIQGKHDSNFIARRHDEILYFRADIDVSEAVNSFNYLGVNNWFENIKNTVAVPQKNSA